MLDHDDGREPVQSPDKLDRLEHLIARHSGCGFVEQRQDRIGREQHPQFHPLAMRVGQCVDLQIEPRRFVEANLVQDRRYRAFKFVSAMQAPPGDPDIFANAQLLPASRNALRHDSQQDDCRNQQSRLSDDGSGNERKS